MDKLATRSIEELKKRAKDGDLHALQELRDQGFFENRKPALDGFAVSNAQKQLWVIDQMLGGKTPVYNMPGSLLLEGPLDVPVLEEALGEIVRRHESLRTTFFRVDGELRQKVHEAVDFAVERIDLRTHERPDEAARHRGRKHAAEPFDIERGPLFRAALLHLDGPDLGSHDPPDDGRYVLLYNLHHIICDEWSLGVLVRELSELYRALGRNQPSPLPPLSLQYKDFTARQNRKLQDEEVRRHRRYWLAKFAGDLEPLNLATDFFRPAVQTFAGDSVLAHFDPDTSEALRRISRDLRAGLYVTLLSLVKALFHRYTGQEDVTIGCPVAGREQADLENQIGFYVNTLALRDRVTPSDTFAELIGKVRQTVTEGIAHQDYPFESILAELPLRRDMSHSPLFDAVVVLSDDQQQIDLEGIRVSEFDTGFVQAKFDFVFDFSDGVEGIGVRLTYNRDLYSEERIRNLVRHLGNLACEVARAPEARLGTLEVTDPEERRLLKSFNPPESTYPAGRTIHGLFEEQVSKTPDRIALIDTDEISYSDLNARANRWGHALREKWDIQAETPVGVLVTEKGYLVPSLLAILKAGGTYVPIDPALPAERTRYILEDSGCRAVLTDIQDAQLLDSITIPVVAPSALDRFPEAANPDPIASSRNLAYIIYTSGSTGLPKGVMVEHEGFVNMIYGQIQEFDMRPDDRVVQFASCSFDASLSEIFMALLAGATLVTVPEAATIDPQQFVEFITSRRVTMATLPPSYLRAIGFDELRGLKILVSAGEEAIHDSGLFAREGRRYINAYGPTEFSVCATTFTVPPGFPANRAIPIGRPIPNAEVLILEVGGVRLQPLGIAGEICLSGVNVARGYVNLPDLTKEKFWPHPLRSEGRIYRTGDLGRWLPDGTIEYLGRLDQQVKIDGYRIELGEIESQLTRHVKVGEAVAAVRERLSANRVVREIVAYIVPSGRTTDESSLEISDLRDFLAQKLPDYMVPTHFVLLDALPRMVSGKLDRRNLPDPMGIAGRSTPFVQPEGDIEEGLSSILQDVLGVDRVGAEDAFLDLGGNSMKAIVLAGRVLKELHVKLDIREVFEVPTVRKLAGLIRGRDRQTALPIRRVPDAEHYAVSNSQRRLWIIDRMDVNRAAYNIASVTRLRGDLASDILERSLSELAKRHESLRTRFVEIDGEPRQIVDEIVDRFFLYEDLRGTADSAGEARERALAEAGREFDLTQAPLFRTTLFRAAADDHFLVFNMHHIISDGWSLDIIIGELLELYRTCRAGDNPALAPLRIQYRDYARWQNDRIVDDEMDGEKRYWVERFGDVIPVLDLPADAPRPVVQSFRGAIAQFELPGDVSTAIRELARRHETSLFMACTAAVKILLYRYTGSEDIVVGAPVAGRNHPDLGDQVGFFVNMLALRDRLAASDPAADVIGRVKSTIETALDHSSYPFDLLVEELDLDRDMGRNPLFDVVVSFRDAAAQVEPIAGLDVEPVPFQPEISKFDLTFFFEENGDGSIGLAIEYSTDLYRSERIQRMADHLHELVRSMARNPAANIGSLDIQTRSERIRLLSDFNRTATDYPREATVTGLFEEQVRRVPDRTAAVCRKDRFDYRQLNNLSNQVAAVIRTRVDLREEEPVGILLERSSWTAVAALAVLKAGGVYLPLDPAYPAERLAFITGETGCRLVLTGSEHVNTLRSLRPGLVAIDLASLPLDGDVVTPDPESRGTANSLAYIMFTSGSTGRPKGVQIENRSIIRLVRNTNYIRLSQQECILQASSLAFDASTFEIWGALLNGGCVCFPRDEVLLEPGLLEKAIRDFQVTTMWITASLFNQLVDADPRTLGYLKRVLTGGEKVSTKHVNRARETNPGLELILGYGPTENTTFTACHRVDRTYEGDMPLGLPVSNTVVYVLDDNLQPCPIGIPGEICTGGDGVARGYLARPELTREKFVASPFVENDILFRTGDLGFWNADGTLSFLGRADDQVKVRGFRVEPGEIEHHMREHPSVTDACVLTRQTVVGTRELVGYYTASARLDAKPLQDFLGERLPRYMVPSHFVYMERFPINRSGKTDRSALPNLQVTAERDYLAPVTRSEEAVTRILAAVLGTSQVGLHDNFLELGGDSIRAIQVVSRLKQENLALQVKDLLQAGNIQDLAGRVRIVANGSPAKGIAGPVPLTPIQEWFFREHEHDLHHFNQAVLLKCSGRLDENGFRDVFEGLHRHHDMLRATFRRTAAGWIQEVKETSSTSVESVDLRQTSDPTGALEKHAARIQGSFDLSTGPLARVVIYRMDDGDRLLIAIHHLLVDGVSWRILLEDLETGYRQIQQDQDIKIAHRTDAYRTWSESVRRFAESDDVKDEVEYWRIVEATDASDIPLDFDRTGVDNLYRLTETVAVSLSEGETRAFLSQPQRAYRADADVTLLAALGRALRRWHHGDATRIIVEGHGREPLDEDLDLTRTVGWFTSMYPFVLRSGGADRRQAIRETKEDLRSIPRRGVSYGISKYLSSSTPPAPSSRRSTLVFNYLGQFDAPRSGEDTHEPFFSFAEESHGPVFGPQFQRQTDLDLTGIVSGERLQLSVVYHPGLHRRETVVSFLENYRQELLDLLDHCRGTETVEKTPTDFTGCPLSLPEFDAFLATAGWRPNDIDDVYPLSPMQAGLLYQDTLNQDSTAYFLQMSFTLGGALDVDCFQAVWEEVIERQAILRTAFVQDGLPEPLQVVLKHRPAEFRVEDIASLSAAEQDRRIRDVRTQDMARGFDLQSDPLVRFAVLRLSPKRHQVIWSYHHILLDGWSLGNLYDEFSRLYEARVRGTVAHLPPVRPYSRYIEWMQSLDTENARAFWNERLEGIEQATSIPTLPGARPEEEYGMGEITFRLTGEHSHAVSGLAQQAGVTISTLMQTVWAIVLSRYQDTTDIVFGAIVSGRPSDLEHVEEMVGLFINAIPLRIRLDEDRPFQEFLRTVQDQAMEAEPFHYYPLAEIQTLIPSLQEIFDHLFVFENYPTDRVVSQKAPGAETELTIESVSSHDETHYPFNLIVVPGDAIEFRLTYNEHIYPEEQILQVRDHLLSTLTQVVERPFTPVGEIQIMPAAERARLDLLHGSVRETPASKTVLDLIDEQVRAVSGRTALIRDGEEMSYDSLNRRANQLARYLRDRFSIGPDDRVGIMLDRTQNMIVSILGVLKAGGAYLPIDADHPRERIAFMLADSGARVVLTESRSAGLVPDSTSAAIVCLDQADRDIRSQDERELDHRPAGQDAVYVIYTSGSTGTPKGCVVEHRNLFNYLTWASDHYFHNPDVGHFGLFSTLSFDLTVTSLFLPLIRGNTLTIYSSDAEMSDIFAHMLGDESRVDSLKITPSHVSLLKEFDLFDRTAIQVAIVGGEALLPDQVALLNDLNPAMRVFNEYGPTETTVGCIVFEVPSRARQILIGKPIANTRIYVLDGQKRITPIGIPGEIYIAGSGVSRGYLNRVDLNAERFLDSPFVQGERMYRSGDLGRWLPDGNMEYLGRRDDQVKIRGHRIEPGEIESVLLQCPQVDRVAVVAAAPSPQRAQRDETELAAYVVGDVTAGELRSWVSRRLPDYMVPSWFIPLDELPLTRNGKLDLRSLPDPVQASVGRRSPVDDGAPRDELESGLRDIWATALRVESLGIHDNFFELGGHSLKATQIVSRILKTMGVKLSLRDFIHHNTVAELAEKIRPLARQDKFSGIQPAPYQETYELSHAQKRLWLLDRLGAAASYNVPQAYVIHGDLDVDALRRTFEVLVERHEILRTAFVEIDGEPRQKILSSLTIAVQETDLTDSDDPEVDARSIVEEEAAETFDLSRPPLLRVRLVKIDEGKCILVMNMHHIVGDGWSMNVFFLETMDLFNSFRTGEPHTLVPLRIQYKDFSEWQNRQPFEKEESYWLTQLSGNAGGIRLPFDLSPTETPEFRGALETTQIAAELLAALRLLAQSRQTTLANVFLSLFKLFLFRLTKQEDLCVGVSVANRNHPDLEHLIGFFVNVLPVRTSLSADMEFDALLDRVSQVAYEAYDHQDYPFDLMVAKLNPDRVANRQPLVNVLYAFQNYADVRVDIPAAGTSARADSGTGLRIEPFPFSLNTSKFDLTLFVFDDGDRLLLHMEYDTARFRPQTIWKYLETLIRFASMIASPEGKGEAGEDSGV